MVRKNNSPEFKLKIILIIMHLVYILLAVFEIIWLSIKVINIEGLIWLAISGVIYLIPFFSIFIPKKIHHILYKISWTIAKNAEEAQIEADSYNQYKKICILLVVVSIGLVIVGVGRTVFV